MPLCGNSLHIIMIYLDILYIKKKKALSVSVKHAGGLSERDYYLTSGAMKAMVPSSWPWNSPAPVPLDASLAAAPKSAIRSLWPVLSISRLAPMQGKDVNNQKCIIVITCTISKVTLLECFY